jgi:HlyD family secretion protein
MKAEKSKFDRPGNADEMPEAARAYENSADGGSRGRTQRPKTSFRRALGLGMLAFAALFGGVGGWMTLTEISGAVVASGSVSIKGEAKTVQHLDGGIVSEIAVANGDIVQAGDMLLRFDDTLLRANLKIYDNRLSEALARQARLIAERDDKDVIAWPKAGDMPLGVMPGPEIRSSQQKLLEVRRASRRGQLDQLKEKMAQFRNQIEGVTGLKTAKAQQIALIGQELDGLHRLYKAGNTTITRLLALEREKSRLLGELAEHDSQIARIANMINETKIMIVQVDREIGEKVLSELRTTEQEIHDLAQQYHATRERLHRVIVRAPVAGMVHQLRIYTEGGVIAPGGPVMQIVPLGEEVEVVAQVQPQFIDELSKGQRATLIFSAFNQHDVSQVDGSIRSISPLTVVNEKTGASYYVVHVGVSDQELEKLGGRKRLVPGMPVEAFIQKADRTVLDYIVRPIVDQIRRAFRED